MAMKMRSFVIVLCLSVPSTLAQDDPSYDHQTLTYDASFSPLNVTGAVEMAPFFSPDHAVDTTVDLINAAVSSIDVAIPSIGSWLSQCAGYVDDDTATPTCTPGCSPGQQRNETFPVFPALLNALHRGVTVRLVTNDYNMPDCPGTITQLQFLALNGAQVKYYATTTFVHAKYQSIDNGNLTAVSSINWSKASMTKNREAGVLISGSSSEQGAALTAYMQAVFEHDFDTAYNFVVGSWGPAELAIIRDPRPLPVVLPNISVATGMFVTPAPKLEASSSSSITTVQTSPDSAWDTIQANINSAETSIQIAMYQITTDELCSNVLQLMNRGVNVSLLVSSFIYDATDCSAAQQCYAQLYNGGLRFRKSSTNYQYSHDKYWIVDGKVASWSTGNWSPSDYPVNHSNTYPPFGDADWYKSNRDFTLYTDSEPVVSSFNTVFNNDWFAPDTADFSLNASISCGY